MKLNINKKENEVVVNFNKTSLKINLDDKDKNMDWTTERINDFLIDLSSAVELDDKIEVVSSEDENKVYGHIVEIFTIFANEFNE